MDRPLYIYAILLAPLLFVLAVLRFLQVVRQTHAGKRRRAPLHKVKQGQPCRLVVFLGSGGHTGEMIRLLYGLDFDKYPTRIYLVSSGDNLSLAKVKDLEAIKAKKNGQSSGVSRGL
jgi:beta-1,4-N-acetylglucosaminyltransferase